MGEYRRLASSHSVSSTCARQTMLHFRAMYTRCDLAWWKYLISCSQVLSHTLLTILAPAHTHLQSTTLH